MLFLTFILMAVLSWNSSGNKRHSAELRSLTSRAIFIFGYDEFSWLGRMYMWFMNPQKLRNTTTTKPGKCIYFFRCFFLCLFLPCQPIITQNYRVEHHDSLSRKKRERDASDGETQLSVILISSECSSESEGSFPLGPTSRTCTMAGALHVAKNLIIPERYFRVPPSARPQLAWKWPIIL